MSGMHRLRVSSPSPLARTSRGVPRSEHRVRSVRSGDEHDPSPAAGEVGSGGPAVSVGTAPRACAECGTELVAETLTHQTLWQCPDCGALAT